jgi:asparagine synthase (glutamine-hydrolysing)
MKKMCGIAGYVQRQTPPDGLIERMTARLSHRGPDGQGIWRGTFGDWSIALGHRRLAIIDIEGGRQPLADEESSTLITYNGEVYNFQSLREELKQRGHRFATRSDTEVVLHHYREHGADGLAALDGMFAMGIWDQRAGRLTLARDRVGIKPLYYAPLPDGGIAFASELSALLIHPDVDRRIDPNGLACYFFLDYVHPPHTIVRGARKLETGSYLTWANGVVSESKRFWKLELNQQGGNARDLSDVLRGKLHAAVKSQLVSDVPVGVFLSGGIDSSLVAALAQRHSTQRLKTFTIRFEDPQFDESIYARKAAIHIGSEHVEEKFSEASLIDELDDALACLDEPMADSSILPTYALSRLAARHVKVALGGDGGDELWAGYPTYKAHRMAMVYRCLPGFFRRGMIQPIVGKLPVQHGYQSFEWKAKRFALRWDDAARARHFRWMSNLDLASLGDAICGEFELPMGLGDPVKSSATQLQLNEILALDFATYLPGSVLTKVDRASMAHGLEVRPPMLANELVDFAFGLPASCKLKGLTTKWLLKQAAADLVPAEVIHRRKKGFAIPLAAWLRGPLRPRVIDVMASSPVWETGLLNRDVFVWWQHEHETGVADWSRALYGLIVLDHWLRKVSDLPRGRDATAVNDEVEIPQVGSTPSTSSGQAGSPQVGLL